MTFQTGICTVITALSTAVKATVAEHTAFVYCTGLAVRTMFSVIGRTLHTKFTFTAPLIEAIRTTITALTEVACIYQAVSTVRAVALLCNGTILAHLAVFAPVVCTFRAKTTDRTPILVILHKTCSTFRTCRIIIKVTLQTGIRTFITASSATVKATMTDHTTFFCCTSSAIRAMFFFV